MKNKWVIAGLTIFLCVMGMQKAAAQINLGGGAEYRLGKTTSFSELKYVLGNNQLPITAGVRLPIN